MTGLNQYYKQIQRKLPCSITYKKRLIHELRGSVDSYLKEHPNADISAIEMHFGTPEQISTAYSSEMGTSDIIKKYRTRKHLITIVASVMAAALVFWLIALIIASIDAADDARGYIETGSVIIEEEVYK